VIRLFYFILSLNINLNCYFPSFWVLLEFFDFSTFLDTAAAAVLPALGLVVLGVLLGVFVAHAGPL
jgi:hypothetical protein